MKPEEEHYKENNKVAMDDLNRELLHAEHDIKKFKKLIKNSRNFIRNQETLDGNIKKTRGNNYALLNRIACLDGKVFDGVTTSADLKSILNSNAKHKPHFIVGQNLNQVMGDKPVHIRIQEWIGDCRIALSSNHNMTLAKNQALNGMRRKEKINRQIEKALNTHNRILVLRVDLSYSDYIRHDKDINTDLSHLTKNIKRNKQLNKGLIFGVIKVEFGLIKGPHAHLLLVYDANIRWRDDRIGDLLGAYWKNTITAGEGTYFNANRRKAKENLSRRIDTPVKQLGIGMLKKDDADKLENLGFVIHYLSKDEQRMISQPGKRLRSLRMFTMPSNRGR